MKVIEFHPDELIDRELRGTLTREERARLDDHLAHCHACRLERQLRADFAEELAPHAPPRDLQLFVSGALQVAQERQSVAPKARDGEAEPPARSPLRRSRRFVIAFVAALTLGAGLALGQDGWIEEAWRALGAGFGPVFGTKPPESAARARPARLTARNHAVRPVPPPPVPAQPLPAQALPSEAAQAASPVLDVRNESMASDAARALRAQAELLFERANRARHQGDAPAAGLLYRALQARFPRSAEARLSLALMARMQLDQGHDAAALASFDAYLATPDRALREEAMAGRAHALAKLGRTRASEQAFAELLRAYPDSAYAALARRRLGQQESP